MARRRLPRSTGPQRLGADYLIVVLIKAMSLQTKLRITESKIACPDKKSKEVRGSAWSFCGCEGAKLGRS